LDWIFDQDFWDFEIGILEGQKMIWMIGLDFGRWRYISYIPII